MKVTLEQIKDQLNGRKNWKHGLRVVAIIETNMKNNKEFAEKVENWLTDKKYSTIYLRDEIMEEIRFNPEIVEIGKQFNPTTEWDNTWLPLDSAIYRTRLGLDPKEW